MCSACQSASWEPRVAMMTFFMKDSTWLKGKVDDTNKRWVGGWRRSHPTLVLFSRVYLLPQEEQSPPEQPEQPPEVLGPSRPTPRP